MFSATLDRSLGKGGREMGAHVAGRTGIEQGQNAEAVMDGLLERLDAGCTCMQDSLLRLIDAEMEAKDDLRNRLLLQDLRASVSRRTNRDIILYNIIRILRES